jgi:arabinose-5-phosphate isomerase
MTAENVLKLARELLKIESRAIEACAERLDDSFVRAVECLFDAHKKKQKIILMGVGKSHYVARKLAASFMSTGVTALFIHPGEALHGDLGVIHPGDACILISKSGNTAELLSILPFLRGRNPTIAITGLKDSSVARQCDFSLDASVEKEACPINLLPSASTTVALALGDALVASLVSLTGFTREDFALFHPGGSIGKRLNHRVKEVIHGFDRCASGKGSVTLKEVAQAMGTKPLGAFCVVSSDQKLLGIITEGDLRRAVAQGFDLNAMTAEKIMNREPVVLNPEMVIEDALSLMEQNDRKVGCAPVLDPSRRLLGMVRIHDLI